MYASNSKSGFAIGFARLRALLIVAVIIGLTGGIVFLFAKSAVHDKIRCTVESELNATLESIGMRCSVGSARFHNGRGIRLRNLRIFESTSIESPESQQAPAGSTEIPGSIVELNDVFIHSDAKLEDLVFGKPNVEAVDINRALLQLSSNENGEWNIQPLIQKLREQARPTKPIPIRLRESEIVLQAFVEGKQRQFRIKDAAVDAFPIISDETIPAAEQPSPAAFPMEIRGTFATALVDNVDFLARIYPVRRQWSARIIASDAKLDSRIFELIPESARDQLFEGETENSIVRATINVDCQASGTTDMSQPVRFELGGDVRGVTVDDARLPFPVRNGRAQFRVTANQIDVWDVSADTDTGDLTLAYSQQGLFSPENWRLKGQCDGLVLSPRLSNLLPVDCKELWDRFSPTGTLNLTFDVTAKQGEIERDVHAKLLDISFLYEALPYQLNHCLGDIHWKGDLCSIDVKSLENDQVVKFNGEFLNPGPRTTGFVNVQTVGNLPIDKKLLTALEAKPKYAQQISKFRPSGSFSLIGRVDKPDPDKPGRNSYDIKLHQCSVRHTSFDYPFYEVNGIIRVRPDQVVYENLRGINNNGLVTCNGTWTPQTGLSLNFIGRTVALDNQLHMALTPQVRKTWSDFRPRGVLDQVSVDLTYLPETEEISITISTEIFANRNNRTTAVSIQPVWFPYEVNNISGKFRFEEGVISIRKFNGMHDRTWIKCNGKGRYDENGWGLTVSDLLVGSLKTDSNLMRALPPALAEAVRQIRFEGQLNVQGEIILEGQSEIASNDNQDLYYVSTTSTDDDSCMFDSTMSWDLRLDTDGARLNTGLQLEDVCGSVLLRGRYDGASTECSGELTIDSLMYNSTQFTNLKGPMWIDGERIAIGSMAHRTDSNESTGQAPRSLTSGFYGGSLALDAQMDLETDNFFYVQATIRNCNLRELSQDLIPRHKNLSGVGFATVKMHGNVLGAHSLRGNGSIHMRNARIEVPVMRQLGKLIKIADLDRAKFDEGNVEFTIQGEDFNFQNIEVVGNAISIIGSGTVNQSQEIDMDFYTVLGRNRINIPVLTQLLRRGSKEFLQIEVDGTLESPNMTRTVLSSLGEPLRALLNDLDSRSDRNRQPGKASEPDIETLDLGVSDE